MTRPPTGPARGSRGPVDAVHPPAPAGHPALPPALRRPLAMAIPPAGAVVLLLALATAGEAAPGAPDGAIRSWVAALHVDRALLLAVDAVGEPAGVVLSIGLLVVGCAVAGRARLAVATVLSIGAAGIVVTAVKPVVGRTIHGSDNLAFPSGHTATATLLGMLVALLLADLARARPGTRTAVVATGGAAGAGVMAFGQVGLDAHYPSDTVGGAAVAVCVVIGSLLLVDRAAER